MVAEKLWLRGVVVDGRWRLHNLVIPINNVLSFEELLELAKSFKIHHRNIQSLAIELLKIKSTLSVTIML